MLIKDNTFTLISGMNPRLHALIKQRKQFGLRLLSAERAVIAMLRLGKNVTETICASLSQGKEGKFNKFEFKS